MIKRYSQQLLTKLVVKRIDGYGFGQIPHAEIAHENCRMLRGVARGNIAESKPFVQTKSVDFVESKPLADQTRQDMSITPRRKKRFVEPPVPLVGIVHRSQFLRDLVDMGVNLNRIARNPSDIDFLISIRSWDNGARERLKFLLQSGVPTESLAAIITQNPKILDENLEDMEVRVNYLLSKNFTMDNITNIILGCPKLLSMQTRDIDARLGYLQAGFRLTGNQVRNLIIESPWLVSWPEPKLKATVETLIDSLGFNIWELKSLLLNSSSIWKVDTDVVTENVHFLHFELGLSHKNMVNNSELLYQRPGKMKERYKFMVYMKRVNFNPSKEHYTPYNLLWKGSLEDFCNRLHTSVEAYELYLKSL